MPDRASRPSPPMLALALLRRGLKAIAYAGIGAFVVLLAVGVHLLNARPDLRVWHEAELDAEFEAGSDVTTLAGYLALEDRLFAQLEERVDRRLRPEERTTLNRHHAGSLSDPGRWPVDWNRSFELVPDAPRAGVLLLHGMSDSPYSLRHLAAALHARGVRVLGLRLPGHGTAASGLVHIRWPDLTAATALGLGHLREQLGERPVWVIGYSNGGALATYHAIAALEDPSLPAADGLVLVSPSIGVTRLAVLAVWQARLGVLLGMPKLAWSSIQAEYDPFKYNSFAVNAGDVVFRLTAEIAAGLDRLRASGRIADFPPVLAFQSLTDATVSTRAVIDGLFLRLPEGGHELVLFDLNRASDTEELLASDPRDPIKADLRDVPLPFDLGFVTNRSEESSEAVLRHKRAGTTEILEEPLGLAWPHDVFSLSHIALPFPESDPLYGSARAPASPGIEIGRAELRGERGVLTVSATDLIRLRWNPFYDFLERRVLQELGLGEAAAAAAR